VATRQAFLTDYQDAAYGARYAALVRRVEAAEAERTKGRTGLALAVARYYFKLLAYKDEYEVARLYADPAFQQNLVKQFEGDYRIEFNLAPPLLARTDPATGVPRKMRFGGWMLTVFRLLAPLKRLRGTALDIFGYSQERRIERQLITDYEALVEELLTNLGHDNHRIAIDLASLPEQIRGYGHVKTTHLAAVKERETKLLTAFRNPRPLVSAAE